MARESGGQPTPRDGSVTWQKLAGGLVATGPNTIAAGSHKAQHEPGGADALTSLTDASFAAANKDGADAVASLRTFGTAAGQAAKGSAAEYVANKGAANGYMGLDGGSRGAQAPKLHKADHEPGGADPLTLLTAASFAAASVNGAANVAGLRSLDGSAGSAAPYTDVRLTSLVVNALDPQYTGANDDATLANALADAIAKHAVLYVPYKAGGWNLTQELVADNTSGWAILGSGGRGSATVINSTVTTSVLKARGATNVILRGVNFNGSSLAAGGKVLNLRGQYTTGVGPSTKILVEDVKISMPTAADGSSQGIGILLEQTYGIHVRDTWINGGLVGVQGAYAATLNGSHTFPTATVTINESTAGWPSSGTILVGRGSYTNTAVTYTGLGVDGHTFTGCTGGTGTYAGGSAVGINGSFSNANTIDGRCLFQNQVKNAVLNPGVNWSVNQNIFEPLWGPPDGGAGGTSSHVTGAVGCDVGYLLPGTLEFSGNWMGDTRWWQPVTSTDLVSGTGAPITLAVQNNASTHSVAGLTGLVGQKMYVGAASNATNNAGNLYVNGSLRSYPGEVVTITAVDAGANTITITGAGAGGGLVNSYTGGVPNNLIPAGGYTVLARGDYTQDSRVYQAQITAFGNHDPGYAERFLYAAGPAGPSVVADGGAIANKYLAAFDLGLPGDTGYASPPQYSRIGKAIYFGNCVPVRGGSLRIINEGGLFGDGSDGALHLDGTSAVAGFSRSGTTYTATRDVFATTILADAGVAVQPAGNAIYCAVGVNNGTISYRGNDGTAVVGGPATTAVRYGAGQAGGAGGTNAAGTAGSGGAAGQFQIGAGGAGGAGSSTAGGAAGAIFSSAVVYRQPWPMAAGAQGFTNSARSVLGGSGGGGGGGDGTNRGGGGGSGGGVGPWFAGYFANNGTITVAGGNGFTPTTGNCGGGGGGGGGCAVFYTLQPWAQNGTLITAGGTHGNGVGTGANGSDGAAGQIQNYVIA